MPTTPPRAASARRIGPLNFPMSAHLPVIIARPGSDIGLLFFTAKVYSDFELRLQFRLDSRQDNSGVFVRFRNPRLPVPDRYDPSILFPYNNQALVGVDTGFEVQIDETARPDGADKHRTGAIYNIPTEPNAVGGQKYNRPAPLRVGAWNEYEIEVIDQTYKVRLNGEGTSVGTKVNPRLFKEQVVLDVRKDVSLHLTVDLAKGTIEW